MAASPNPNRVVVLSNLGTRADVPPPDQCHIQYAVGLPNGGTYQWNQRGTIGNPNVRAIDPGIAYNPIVDDFLAIALYHDADGVAIARWNPDTDAFPFHTGWSSIVPGAPGGDRPFIVAGEMSATVREFYVTHSTGPSPYAEPRYFHTTDGGTTWVTGPIAVGGQQIYALPPLQPAVSGAGPLYVAFPVNTASRIEPRIFRFIVGTDNPTTGEVTFNYYAGQ